LQLIVNVIHDPNESGEVVIEKQVQFVVAVCPRPEIINLYIRKTGKLQDVHLEGLFLADEKIKLLLTTRGEETPGRKRVVENVIGVLRNIKSLDNKGIILKKSWGAATSRFSYKGDDRSYNKRASKRRGGYNNHA